MKPSIQHHKVCQIAELKAAIDGGLITEICGSDGHPFMVSLPRAVQSCFKVALAIIMVFGTSFQLSLASS